MGDKNKTTNPKEKKYSKDTFLKGKTYRDKKDLINAIWSNEQEQFTKKEVQQKIDNYLEREV